jgi:hypothetical protein
VKLTSEVGDYVGGGNTYSYSQADTVLKMTATGGQLTVGVLGNQQWLGNFKLPTSYTEVAVGVYDGLRRWPVHVPSIGGLLWEGEGRACSEVTGSFTVKKAVYDGPDLMEVALEFVQYCDGRSAALRGEIYWNARDAARPAGPVVPVPADLWQPRAGVTPATGNYVYLESPPLELIGGGENSLYTSANASIGVSVANRVVAVSVAGDKQWFGSFEPMNSIPQLALGYYPDLARYPFNNPAKGGLAWGGDGRACNTLTGWFAVDRVVFEGPAITALELRFAQYCSGSVLPLHGKIRWAR